MGELAHLNIPGFSGAKNLIISRNESSFCICCLVENVPLLSLENCKHVEFFDCYFQFKLEYPETSVCYACHSMLKDIYQFKIQVESSLSNLKERINEFQLNTIKLSKLQQSNIEIFHTQNSEPIEKEVIETNCGFEIKTEVKVEIEEESSEPENDVPLSELKEKEGNEKEDPNTEYFQYRHQGKIKLIMLSETEMVEDRKREAMKEKYLKLLFKCQNCIVGFDHEQSLKEHMEKKHTQTNGAFTCAICKSVLSSVASYQGHIRRHYLRVDCGVCGQRYNNVVSAQAHYNKNHAEAPPLYKCEECGYTTPTYRRLRYHRETHKGKVSCNQCDKLFVNNVGLKQHILTVHKVSSRTYSCAECDKHYRQRSGLLSHMRSVHNSRGAYCEPCRTHFRTEQNLKTHLNTHSKHTSDADKKNVCSVCGARFLMRCKLQEHIEWEHNKNTKHKCEECDKVFKSNSSMRRHIAFVHEKKRPPRDKMCDHCGRGFTTMAILGAHIRTHTGERPHACARCPATFAHSAALYTHNKLLHASKQAAV